MLDYKKTSGNGRYFLGATPSLKETVYEALRKRIISGDLLPGTKLNEEALCEEMGISRAPLREAFNMLDRDGFVQMIPRKGTVVADFTEEDVSMIWDIRAMLEPNAAVLSLPNIPEGKLKEVRDHLIKILDDPNNFEEYINTDLEVHSLLVDYIDNHYLSDMIWNIKEHSVRMRWNVERRQDEVSREMIIQSTNEHLTIVDALIAKDEQAIFDSVKEHLMTSKKRTMKLGG